MPARRLKVMLAIDGMGIGGAEMVVRDLVRHLDPSRFEVCICCTKGLSTIGEELKRDGVDIFVLPAQHVDRVDYLTAPRFRRIVQERHIDIVHTHAMPALLDAAPSRLTVPRLKVVHTFHYGNYPYTSWRHHLMEGACAWAVDRLVTVGWDQRRRVQAAYRLSDARTSTIWNGITPVTPQPPDEFRERMGTGKRLLIGTIAKLIEQKGLDDLLAVARRCRDAGHEMQFVIVGEGPLRPMLEQRRRDLGLEDTVALPGWVPEAAAQALPAFDVFFQPSRWEAMSIAILEAMAGGKPIVATRVGDNPYVLEDGASGLLVDAGDIDAMAEALTRMTSAALRNQIAATAQARFGERFTLQRMIDEYSRLYGELAAS